MLNPLNFISKIFKSSNQKELDKLQKIVKQVNNYEDQVTKIEDSEFPKKTEELRELGELINYNAYGETIDDLHFSPEVLFKALQPFSDPFEFYHASGELNQLREGFRNDMRKAESELPVRQTSAGRIYQFQNQAWCRRVSGVFSNQVAREALDLAHALLVERKDGTFLVGVRAPISKPQGAEKLCIKFSGGGRAAAAGINNLAPEEVDRFFDAFDLQFTI